LTEPNSDPRPLAVPTRQVENDRFIVTEWCFAPGAHTGWHRHAYDYVIVPMTTGRLHLKTPAAPATGDLVTGIAYSRQAGVEHDVINDNPYEFVFIEIEAKT
jgi:quercetin dioxygenase-like cupin family protein